MKLSASPGRVALRQLGDAVVGGDPSTVEAAVDFVVRDSSEVGDGRARARLARRLKHVALDNAQQQRLVTAVVERLHSGRFSEQFDDQWRLALHLDSTVMVAAATTALHADRAFIVRTARRILRAHEQRSITSSLARPDRRRPRVAGDAGP